MSELTEEQARELSAGACDLATLSRLLEEKGVTVKDVLAHLNAGSLDLEDAIEGAAGGLRAMQLEAGAGAWTPLSECPPKAGMLVAWLSVFPGGREFESRSWISRIDNTGWAADRDGYHRKVADLNADYWLQLPEPKPLAKKKQCNGHRNDRCHCGAAFLCVGPEAPEDSQP